MFGLNGGKAEGWRGAEGDAPAVGEQDNTTASHMWARGGVGVKAAGAAHSGIVIRGGGMQLIRFLEKWIIPSNPPLGKP